MTDGSWASGDLWGAADDPGTFNAWLQSAEARAAWSQRMADWFESSMQRRGLGLDYQFESGSTVREEVEEWRDGMREAQQLAERLRAAASQGLDAQRAFVQELQGARNMGVAQTAIDDALGAAPEIVPQAEGIAAEIGQAVGDIGRQVVPLAQNAVAAAEEAVTVGGEAIAAELPAVVATVEENPAAVAAVGGTAATTIAAGGVRGIPGGLWGVLGGVIVAAVLVGVGWAVTHHKSSSTSELPSQSVTSFIAPTAPETGVAAPAQGNVVPPTSPAGTIDGVYNIQVGTASANCSVEPLTGAVTVRHVGNVLTLSVPGRGSAQGTLSTNLSFTVNAGIETITGQFFERPNGDYVMSGTETAAGCTFPFTGTR